jgi:hypothetical protein
MAGAATTQPVSTVISMGVLFFLSYGILEISVLGIYLSLFKRVLLSRPQSKLCRVTNSFCFIFCITMLSPLVDYPHTSKNCEVQNHSCLSALFTTSLKHRQDIASGIFKPSDFRTIVAERNTFSSVFMSFSL